MKVNLTPKPKEILRMFWKHEGRAGPLFYVVPSDEISWTGQKEEMIPFAIMSEDKDTAWYSVAVARKIAKVLNVELEEF